MTNRALVSIAMQIADDDSPEASWLEQDGFEERLAAYKAGEFGFVGVRAVATVKVPYGHDWIVTTIKSPGLWGIESDSAESYLQEVFATERAILLDMLQSLKDWQLTE